MSAVPAYSDPGIATDPARLPCAIALPEHEFLVPAQAHTLSGFRAWARSDDFPQRGRISFLNREIIIDMSPEELETHNKAKSEIYYSLITLNKKRKLGELYTDRTLLTNEEANLSTEPDGLFVTWRSLESKQARLVPRKGEEGQYLEIEGTPDWVLEIVSDSSVAKDTRRLRERYHKAGIAEYWLIDARGDEIDFQILVWQEEGYVPAPISRGGWQVSRVFGRRFRLTRRRNRAGRWEYTLQVKSLR